MGTKVQVVDLTILDNASGLPKINANFDTVADEFDSVIYKDGSVAMDGNFDMDSNRIINLPYATTSAEPPTYRQVVELNQLISGPTEGTIGTIVADRVLLAAVTPIASQPVWLSQAQHEGFFVWRSGNYSAKVALDTQQGIYVASNVSGYGTTVGCWVRATGRDEYWSLDWFDVPPANSDGTGANATTAYNAMMAIVNSDKPAGIVFGPNIYSFDSKPTPPTYVIGMRFSAGTQPTILCKRYSDTTYGVLSIENYGAVLENPVYITAIGSGIAANNKGFTVKTGASALIGEVFWDKITVSMGGATGETVAFDGSANVSAPVGLRDVFGGALQVFGNLRIASCQHFLISELFVDTDVTITGGAVAKTDDIHLYGVIGQNLELGEADASSYIERLSVDGEISNNVLNFANVKKTKIASRIGGTVFEQNWEVATCYYTQRGLVVSSGSNANGKWRKFGDGRIEQWGTVVTVAGVATVTFPIAFTSTVDNVSANVSDAPGGGNFINIAQAHSETLTQMTIKAMEISTVPAVALLAANDVHWRATGL